MLTVALLSVATFGLLMLGLALTVAPGAIIPAVACGLILVMGLVVGFFTWLIDP